MRHMTRETPYTLVRETGHLMCESQDWREGQVAPRGSSEEGPSLPKWWTGPHTAQMVPSPSDGPVMLVSLSQE